MKKITIFILIILAISCAKKLELKPDSAIVVPETVRDFEAMLENTNVMNMTASLSSMSADEYYIPDRGYYDELVEPITKTAYIWQKDIYEGRELVSDWNIPYAQVFICNSILDVLAKQNIDNDPEKKRIKGWALFGRAYAFYTLAGIFAKGYDENTATTDLGIPLKVSSAVEEIVSRSSVQQTYDQIIKDAVEASELLPTNIPVNNRNRPSKVACYAFLSRVYTSMRKYADVELFVDKALALHSVLIDYNTLPIEPFSSSWSNYNSPEMIYWSRNEYPEYSDVLFDWNWIARIDSNLRKSYHADDLRRSVYFRSAANGNFGRSKGINYPDLYPFTGLATDELYLIKAECLARRQQKDEALNYLNMLLRTRYKTGKFTDLTAVSASDALDKILEERRKALILRAIRWTDLKRLNLEGRNITLKRNLSGTIYTLEPNSPLYVLPIPISEVSNSGIKQNIR